MIFLICGDRNWTSADVIRSYIAPYRKHFKGLTIVHGDCRGADKIGAAVAKSLDCHIRAFPAKWDQHGKAAGPIRNQQMLDEGKPSMVLAFHDNIEQSRGTADMVRRAKKAGVPVTVINANGQIYG
jgi:hypothetical protein